MAPVRPRIEQAPALGWALARLAFCTYRAIHQSITIDEAYTFNQFIHGSWWNIYRLYDANNHVLYSILAKLSIQLFGLSELSIRLPSLIGGFFLTLGVFQILKITTTSIPIRWMALAGLSLHPLLLDFSIAARGYGLSVAFVVWAVYFSMSRRYALGGLLLGLGLSANLTAIFPAAGLLTAVVLLDDGSWRDRLRNVAVIAAPAQTVFFLICFGALRTAERSHFYVGIPELGPAVRDLLDRSIQITRRSGLLGSETARRVILFLMIPAAAVFIAIGSAIDFVRDRQGRRRLIPVVTLGIAIGGTVAGHYVLSLNYPEDRMALHFLVLFGLTWAIAAEALPRFRWINIALALLLVVQFGTQMQTGYFAMWPEDQGDASIAALLKGQCAGRPDGSVKVSAYWPHESTLEFYRLRLNITQWRELLWIDPMPLEGHDFYVAPLTDRSKLESRGIRVIYSNQMTDVVVGTSWP